VIKVVSDLRQVGGFSPGTPVSSTNKTDRHDITERLLKVSLSTIPLSLTIVFISVQFPDMFVKYNVLIGRLFRTNTKLSINSVMTAMLCHTPYRMFCESVLSPGA
jgi:hypothetical protein